MWPKDDLNLKVREEELDDSETTSSIKSSS